MLLSLISKLCWSVRHISLAIINFTNAIFLQSDYSSWLLLNFVLTLVVLLPLVACTCWCCLALDEWLVEEDERGYLRRMLQEAEDARLKDLDEKKRKKNG